MGNLYIIRNTINDKVYIGKTYNPIEHRFKEHIRTAQNPNRESYDCKFYRAMRKYGIENFYIELIDTFEEGILEQKEIEYIAKYDSFHNGYNSTLGGDGTRILELDEDEIINMWDAGKSGASIAKELGVCNHTIDRILHASGRRCSVKEVSFVAYDDCYNRIAVLRTRNEVEEFLKQTPSMASSHIRDIEEAIERNGSLYGYKWQNFDDVFYEDKEFNTVYDKEQYMAGKECVEINGLWFAERSDLDLNVETGHLSFLDNKIFINGNNGRVVIDIDELVELAKTLTVQQMANKYGVSSSGLEKHLNKHGIKTVTMIKGPPNKRPPKEELEKVKHLPKTQIAKMYGVTGNSVKKWFNVYGITDVYQQPRKMPPREELETKIHMSVSQIAKEYGVNHSTVFDWLKKYGIILDSQIKRRKIPPLCPPAYELEKVSRFSYKDIALIYGVSHQVVMGWFSELNIEKH